jgi:hypothetical protein
VTEYLLGLATTPVAAAILVGIVWLDPQLRRCGFKDRRLIYFGGPRRYLFNGFVHFFFHHRDYMREWKRAVAAEGGHGGRALIRMRWEHPDLLPEHMRRRPVPTLRADWPKDADG